MNKFALLWVVGVLAFATEMPGSGSANEAETPVKVGGVTKVTPEWLSTMQKSQSDFFGTLAFEMGAEWHDDIPLDRLQGMHREKQLDCVVTNVKYLDPAMVHSVHTSRFDLVLFGRTGENLIGKRVVTVGLLATVPYLDLPLTQEIHWYGLRSFDQGAELVKADRIDLFLAHTGLYDNDPLIEEFVVLPSNQALELIVQCHDTPQNRAFLKSFDASLNLLEQEDPTKLPN